MNNTLAKVCTTAAKEGATILTSIDMTARVLAGMMEDAHGGNWCANVDHKVGFILIRVMSDREIPQPKRGEVV